MLAEIKYRKSQEFSIPLLYLGSLAQGKNALSVAGPSFEEGIARIQEKNEPIAIGQQDPTRRLIGPRMDGTDVIFEGREPFRPL